MRGGPRVGAGRKKGAPNKANKAERDKIAASGLTPKDYMLSVMRDEEVPRADRMDAAHKVAPFCHPRLSAMEHSGPNGGPLQVLDLANLTDEQLKQIEPLLRTLAAAGGAAGAGEGGDPPARARGRKT